MSSYRRRHRLALASVVAAGPAPLIAVALLAQYGSGYAVAGYIFVSAIASLAATLLYFGTLKTNPNGSVCRLVAVANNHGHPLTPRAPLFSAQLA